MRRLFPILAILLLAAIFRIVNVGHWPVWTDEGWSAWAISDHRFDVIIDKVVTKDRHAPLYTLALSAWSTIAGESRIALRFLAIASGLLTIAALYRLTADHFGRKPAKYAALLLTVLPSAVYYSQEIRDYGWLTLFVTLMSLFFLRYLRRPQRISWIGYTLSTTLMLYTFYMGGLFLAVQGIVGLFAWRGTRQQKLALIGSWFAALVLYIPWLLLIPEQWKYITGGIISLPTTWEGLLTAAQVLFSGQLALTIGLYVLGLWKVIEDTQKSVRWLAQMTIVLSGLGLYGAMVIADMRVGLLASRTLVFLTPMLMAVCGYGLSLLDRRARNLLAMALVILIPATATPIQPRLDYHSAAQAVAADYTRGDLVILENGWDDNAFRYELLLALPGGKANDAQIIRTLPWVDNKQQPEPVVSLLKDTILAHRRVWVINWFQPSQVIPYLDQGTDGYIQSISHETSVGVQYERLYNAPVVQAVLFERPNTTQPPRVYGDLLSLKDTLFPDKVMRGDRLHIDCWWSALKQLPLDYSVGVFLMNSNGEVKAQHDGSPGSIPTSQWQPDGLMFDRHSMAIPADFPIGHYQIGVQVYWYGDRQPLLVNGENYAIVGQIEVQ